MFWNSDPARRVMTRLAPIVLAWWVLIPGAAPAQERDPDDVDLARVKQEEARKKLERLEETMDRLARLLEETEPQNAAKLRMAFQASRERLLREGMDRIVEYIEEKKLDRAITKQEEVKVDLEELLSILLEKDIDPRELLKHIRRLRDLVKDLDQVITEETTEKMASDEAHQAKASTESLAADLQKLEDLIRREKELEGDAADPEKTEGDGLGRMAPKQDGVRADTRELREQDAQRGQPQPGQPQPGQPQPGQPQPGQPQPGQPQPGQPQPGQPQPGQPQPGQPQPGQPQPGQPQPGQPQPGQPQPGQPQPGQPQPGQPQPAEPPAPEPEQVLNRKTLQKAEDHMERAARAMRNGDVATAQEQTAEARAALEEAVDSGEEKLERLRAQRNFKKMQEEQDETRKDTDDIAERMKEPVPLVPTPEGGTPGRKEVEGASQNMQGASQDLSQGEAGKASGNQKTALDQLKQGREQTEEALEALQRAFRDRLLAYLREKFTKMLAEQRAITRETKSLDLKLRALRAAMPSGSSETLEMDRKDRQKAESLSSREDDLTLLADDALDVLAEDGTSLAFPGVVQEIKDDVIAVSERLSRIDTGERTQFIQGQIEAALEDILRALDEAQKNPPPPNPSQGRQSKSGAGPLLPLSTELKLVRALQQRVNDRTNAFDERHDGQEALEPDAKLQLNSIARKQKEVEGLLRKLSQAMGER